MSNNKWMNDFYDMVEAGGTSRLSKQTLANILVILALITQVGIIRILFEEAEKLEEAIEETFKKKHSRKHDGDKCEKDDKDEKDDDLKGITELNKSVAEVLEQLCCLKEAVVDELKLGFKLLD